MPTNHPHDLVISLDRSDRKAHLELIDTRNANTQKQTVATSPEALHDWLARLRQDHPQASVAICLEQPAANLILFLETYSWITLYPINPITLQKFREAFVTSRAKDEEQIAKVFQRHADCQIFQALPGAGAVLAPRLLATMGSERERFARPENLQSFSGVAPVTKQSGGKCHVHRRYCCPKFLRPPRPKW